MLWHLVSNNKKRTIKVKRFDLDLRRDLRR